MAYLGNQPLLSVMRVVVENTAYEGQTQVTIPGGCISGMTDVIRNGSELSPPDYDDTSGIFVQFATPMKAGEQYRIKAYAPNTTTISSSGQLAGFRNRIINGDMRVAQRATQVAIPANGVNTYGGPDRWFGASSSGSGGVYGQGTSSVTVGSASKLFVQQWVSTVPTSIAGANYFTGISQAIEGFNAYDMIGKPITVSFWFYGTTAGTYGVSLRAIGAAVDVCSLTFQYTNALQPQRVTLTFPAPPTTSNIANSATSCLVLHVGALATGSLQNTSTGSWNTGNYMSAPGQVNWATVVNNYISIGEVQVESGSVATPFEFRQMQTEQALCQRYFYGMRTTPGGTSFGSGACFASTSALIHIPFPVVMRVAPVYSISAVSDFLLLNNAGGGQVVNGATTFASSTSAYTPSLTVAGGLVGGNATVLYAANNNAAMYFNAEF